MIFTVLCMSLYCVIYDVLCCAVMCCTVMYCVDIVQCGRRVFRCMIELGVVDGWNV